MSESRGQNTPHLLVYCLVLLMNETSIHLINMLISERVFEIAPKVVQFTRVHSFVLFLFSTQIVLKIDLTRFNLFNDKILTLSSAEVLLKKETV